MTQYFLRVLSFPKTFREPNNVIFFLAFCFFSDIAGSTNLKLESQIKHKCAKGCGDTHTDSGSALEA